MYLNINNKTLNLKVIESFYTLKPNERTVQICSDSFGEETIEIETKYEPEYIMKLFINEIYKSDKLLSSTELASRIKKRSLGLL